MSNGTFSRRLPALAASILVLPLLSLVSCTGGGTNSTILDTINRTVKKNTLTIRIANDTTSSVSADIRVDGVIKTLPACTPIQRTCEYILATCPQVVELLQETRVDANDVFTGGRNFEGNPEFTFTSGEFQCGDMIMFQFSETEATAQIM